MIPETLGTMPAHLIRLNDISPTLGPCRGVRKISHTPAPLMGEQLPEGHHKTSVVQGSHPIWPLRG